MGWGKPLACMGKMVIFFKNDAFIWKATACAWETKIRRAREYSNLLFRCFKKKWAQNPENQSILKPRVRGGTAQVVRSQAPDSNQ